MFGNSTETLFTFLDNNAHAIRRREVIGVYKPSSLQHNSSLHILVRMLLSERLLPIIEKQARKKTGVDIQELNDCFAVDFMTNFIFGSTAGTDLLGGKEGQRDFLKHYNQSRTYRFWEHELPTLMAVLHFLGLDLRIKAAVSSSRWMDQWFFESSRLRQNDRNRLEPLAILSYHLSRSIPASKSQDHAPNIMPEMHDHAVAGIETLGSTVTRAMHALSCQPYLQRALREDIASFATTHMRETDEMIRPSDLEGLPLLHAILLESIRLRYHGPFPRASCAGAMIGGYPPLPAGVRVSTYSYVLHRNSQVFPAPDEFIPSRWRTNGNSSAPEKTGEQGRYFLGFGAGDRTCVGRDLAMYVMKVVMISIYLRYETSLANIERATTPSQGPSLDGLLFKII